MCAFQTPLESPNAPPEWPRVERPRSRERSPFAGETKYYSPRKLSRPSRSLSPPPLREEIPPPPPPPPVYPFEFPTPPPPPSVSQSPFRRPQPVVSLFEFPPPPPPVVSPFDSPPPLEFIPPPPFSQKTSVSQELLPPPYPWHLDTSLQKELKSAEPDAAESEESLILPGSSFEVREGNRVQQVRILSPNAINVVLDLDHTLGDYDFLIPYLHLLTSMILKLVVLPLDRYPFLSRVTGPQILSWLQTTARTYMNTMGWDGTDRVMKKLIPLYRAGLIKDIVIFTAGKPKPLLSKAQADTASNLSGVDVLENWNAQRIIVEEISQHYKIPLGLYWARPSSSDTSVKIPDKDVLPSLFERASSKKSGEQDIKTRVKDLGRFADARWFVIDDMGGRLYRKNALQQARIYKISPWRQPPSHQLPKKLDKKILPILTGMVEPSISTEEAALVNEDLSKEWVQVRQKYKNYLNKLIRRAQRKPPREYANSGFEQPLLDDIGTSICSKNQDCVRKGEECIHHFCQSPLGIQTPVAPPVIQVS